MPTRASGSPRSPPTSASLAGEYAAHEGGERALFAVLEGRIEAVSWSTGSSASSACATPGDVFGEVPITLGTVFPVGFRAAEPSRVMRIEPHDYHAVAAAAPDVAKEVGRLAAHRIGGPARPPGPRGRAAAAARDRRRAPLGRGLRRAAPLPRPQPDHLRVADARRAGRRDGSGAARCRPRTDWPAIRVIGGKTVVRPHFRRVAELLGLATEPARGRVRHRDRRRRARPGWPRRSTARRRACGRSSSSARRRAARPARRRGSRTTSASRRACPATSWRAARCSRRGGSAPRSS